MSAAAGVVDFILS